MNSITELKEAILADYIMEIKQYSRDRLVQELISIKEKNVEQMSDYELLNKLTMTNSKEDYIDEELFCRKCGKSISKEEVELNGDEMCGTCYAERH